MNMDKKWRGAILAAACLSFAAAGFHLLSHRTAERELREPLNVRLSWHINSNQAGFVAAVEKGFYAEEGLAVTNLPGGVDFPSIQLVASGSDDFGVQSGAESLIVARAQGIPVRAIAILDRKSPYVFYSLAKRGIRTPKDFAGKAIEVSYGRPLEIVYRMLLAKFGVARASVREVKKAPSDMTLFNGTVDVKPGFISDYIFAQAAARRDGLALTALYPADYGIQSYGYTIFTTDKMIEQRPDLVERYLRATVKGWDYAFQNPEECIDMILKLDPGLERTAQLEALKARKEFFLDGRRLGWMEAEVWRSMMRNMLDQGVLREPVDLSKAYTNAFIERIHR